MHFTISRSNYAGVLYIRNMTTVPARAGVAARGDRDARGRRRAGASWARSCSARCSGSRCRACFTTVRGRRARARRARRRVDSRRVARSRAARRDRWSASAAVTFVERARLLRVARRLHRVLERLGVVRPLHVDRAGPQHASSSSDSGGASSSRYYEQRPLAWVVILAFVVAVAIIWRSADRADAHRATPACSRGGSRRGSSSC